jgi:hypothetical protein
MAASISIEERIYDEYHTTYHDYQGKYWAD